jgi:Flp pilus assembly pilin Flp
MLVRLLKNRRGAALVEYALLVAGVALISAAAVSVFGHKTSDMIATVATVLPGAHADDNNPIASGHLIETAPNADGSIALDPAGVLAGNNTQRLNENLGYGELADGAQLVTETGEAPVTP